jgi:hypothetical protein
MSIFMTALRQPVDIDCSLYENLWVFSYIHGLCRTPERFLLLRLTRVSANIRGITTSNFGKNTENLPFIEVFSYIINTVPKSIETILWKQTELWLSISHSQASLFHEKIKVTESYDC